MAVQDIEVYDEYIKVILKPTKAFPVGYFYTDNNPVARELVESYSWNLQKHNNSTYVIAYFGTPSTGQRFLRFHREYACRVLDYYPDYIDHINRLEIDNRDINLNIVTQQQNNRNKPSIGYHFDAKCNIFQPNYALNNKSYIRGSYKTEPEALLATYQLRQEVYADYNYQFLEDRRDFQHLVDKEVKSIITHKEASYIRAKQLIENNPWYAYRYNLFDYCRENNIKIPEFKLDSQGFMIHPITEERFCPY